jgi:hypothetical protein
MAKPSPTSNPQPGPGVPVAVGLALGEAVGVSLALGEAVGVSLALGLGVGVFSPAGRACALRRSRMLEYGNLASQWLSGARITVGLLTLRCASANGTAQTAMNRIR